MTSTPPRIAMVIANNYEDIEADSPKEHLESLGAVGNGDRNHRRTCQRQEGRFNATRRHLRRCESQTSSTCW